MEYANISHIINTLSRHQVSHAVISPGSRSAPLTITFARHPGYKKYIIPDERSAGYIALGIALESSTPVAVICTSGTAAYNLAPSVAEAFYQQIPLLVLTADRPPEWIDQSDGQSIHQVGIYRNNIKKSFIIPDNLDSPETLWHASRIISEAVLESMQFPRGPVHINFPFREPLYPAGEKSGSDKMDIKIFENREPDYILKEHEIKELLSIWEKSSKILIVPGQYDPDKDLARALYQISSDFNIPVLADIIANLNGQQVPLIHKHDLFLDFKGVKNIPGFTPDLLITFGKSVLSKNLKIFLRKFRPGQHWHIQPSGYVPDTFQSLTRIISTTPAYFLDKILSRFPKKNISGEYLKKWYSAEEKTKSIFLDFLKQNEFCEISALKKIMESLPPNSNLHLANSLSVRLVNYIGIRDDSIRVFSNRGTSGIDGCTSTAVGVSLVSDKLNVLITGDMAFFYDRNAFWHQHNISNLRVIILNNHGGEIFRMIDGPGDLPELKEYFETYQELNAENTARDFKLDYYKCTDHNSLTNILSDFFKPSGKAAILEFESNSEQNSSLFLKLKNEINKIWN